MKDITPREREVLLNLFLSDSELADKLCVSLPTIKSHLHNIFDKFEEKKRIRVLLKALKMRIITIEEIPIGEWDIFGNKVEVDNG